MSSSILSVAFFFDKYIVDKSNSRRVLCLSHIVEYFGYERGLNEQWEM